MRPRLKSVAWERDGARLRLVHDVRDRLLVEDPDGAVERLLELLRAGGRTVAELAEQLAMPVDDVAAAVAALDEYRLLEDGERLGGFGAADSERYFSNLGFFETFASLSCSREDFQRRLRAAHVLVLGTGGLNSNTVPHLCGLGVGRLTLLDRDTVDARNFARQYLYRWGQRGDRKVARAGEWVREFDPAIEVDTIDAAVDSAAALAALLDEYAPDVVMSGIDSPADVDDWVNAECVRAGVPYVRGGMWVSQGVVWSVDPGRSACRRCGVHEPDDGDAAGEAAAIRLHATKPRVNRGIGPVAGLLGSLAAFEVLRYLTGFEPPAYAGSPISVDFAAGCRTDQVEWARDPACPVCGSIDASVATAGDAGLGRP
ncbi:ThiF family adenylyltransferase [Actinocatenispora sera]|uniref:HesA/MoeB/ThiF family protein n=1 Tax=Actinocatenispora sera TaxID=390989 RepID=UPI0033C3CAE7